MAYSFIQQVFLPSSETQTPASLARSFAESLRIRYGSEHCPLFLESSYAEALQQSDRQFKPLIVYLHSELHADTSEFIQSKLFNPLISHYLKEHFLVWGASINKPDGYDASFRFEASGYPFLGIYCITSTSTPQKPQYQRLWVYQGNVDVTIDELLNSLTKVSRKADGFLGGIQAERLVRDADRNMRLEQERAYAEAEERDRRKMEERDLQRKKEADALEAKRLEEEQKRLELEEAKELQEAIVMSKQLDKQSEYEAAASRLKNFPEPDSTTEKTSLVNLRFTLPNGAKLQRRFLISDTIQRVRDYVFVTSTDLGIEIAATNFDLTSSYPKKTFAADPMNKDPAISNLDLKTAGLYPQGLLFVTITKQGDDSSDAIAT
jgi:FAS-associated factor 2